MNTNVSESGSLYGKMMAILVVALFALSSFTAMASAGDDEEQEETEEESEIFDADDDELPLDPEE